MHQDCPAAIEPVLNEGVAGGEMLQHVLIVDVVQLDDQVPVGREQGRVERQSQRRHDVRDLRRREGLGASEGE